MLRDTNGDCRANDALHPDNVAPDPQVVTCRFSIVLESGPQLKYLRAHDATVLAEQVNKMKQRLLTKHTPTFDTDSRSYQRAQALRLPTSYCRYKTAIVAQRRVVELKERLQRQHAKSREAREFA